MNKLFSQVPKHIMLIDDDPFSILLSKMKLRKFIDERNINDFCNAQNALEFLGQHLGKKSAVIPDLILLEVMMNNGSGWDFIPQYSELISKHDSSGTQLIVLTSSQFFSDYRRASKYDMVKGFLMKPFHLETLLEVYQNARRGLVSNKNTAFQSFIA
jgi:CheY-like chemotaxis protein